MLNLEDQRISRGPDGCSWKPSSFLGFSGTPETRREEPSDHGEPLNGNPLTPRRKNLQEDRSMEPSDRKEPLDGHPPVPRTQEPSEEPLNGTPNRGNVFMFITEWTAFIQRFSNQWPLKALYNYCLIFTH